MEPEDSPAERYRQAREARRREQANRPTSQGGMARRRELLREMGLLKRRNERQEARSARLPDEALYIGLHSPEDRKRLFLHYFGDTEQPSLDEVTQGPVHTLMRRFMEDPYKPETWYSPGELRALSGETQQQITWALGQFDERYARRHRLSKGAVETSTHPTLYSLEHRHEYFKHLLYERDELFMKVVPLPDDDPEKLIEVYNEVKAAYFLNELVYGYSQVLSLHFMTVVDWFPIGKRLHLPNDPPEGETRFFQVIVSERLEQSLAGFLDLNRGLEPLRAVLFQLFHALETAWHTNYYTHNDAHLGNLMMLRHAEDSPLVGRDFLYRRLEKTHWYRVPEDAMSGHMLKLIDFGRNRMYVPRQAEHTEGVLERHRHDRLLCAPGFDEVGYSCDAPNRQLDVLLPLFGLLLLDTKYWFGMRPLERAEFFSFCERHMDFQEINRLVDDYLWSHDEYRRVSRAEVDVEFSRVRRKVTPHNLRACPNICQLLRVPGLFLYRYRETGSTASDVLDDDFFASYRTTQVLPERPLTQEEIWDVRGSHVVVSFLEHPEEAQQLLNVGLGADVDGVASPRCTACKSSRVSLRVPVERDVYLCGRACYEFRYLFGGKTVYR